MAAAESTPQTSNSNSSANRGVARTRAEIEASIAPPSAKLTRIAACIYGRGGVGKTTLLATMPGRGLVIDIPMIEGGSHVLIDNADRISVLQVSRWEEFEHAFQILRENKLGFDWVAIDSLTGAMNLAKRKVKKERPIDADPNRVSPQDWGTMGELMEELIFKFRTLRMHVLFLAQERLKGSDGTEEMSATVMQPDMSPSALRSLLPPMFLVGRLYVAQADTEKGSVWERRLRVGPHESFVTKIRSLPSRPVPPIIREPKLGEIFAYILGQSKKAPAAVQEATLFS